MSYFAIAALILLSLAGAVLHYHRQKRFKAFVHLLFFALIGMLLAPNLEGEGGNMMFGTIGIISVNFLMGTFLPAKFKRPFVRLIIPVLTTVLFIVYFKGSIASVFGLEYAVVNKFLVIGAVMMLFTLDLGMVKLDMFNKLLGGFSDKRLIKSFTVFMLGLAFFLGAFSASLLGLYILGAVYLSTLFYRKEDYYYQSTSMLGGIAAGLVIFSNSSTVALDLMEGDTLMGLFFGGFTMYFIRLISKSRKKTMFAHIVAYFLPILLGIFLLMLGTQYEKMGGVDALAAMILGIALSNAIMGRGYLGMSILGWILAIGLVVPPYLVNDEAAEFEKEMISLNETNETVEEGQNSEKQEYLSLEMIKGKSAFLADSSKVSFVLGPKKETKGAFKKVNGMINIDESGKLKEISVEMSLNNLTTFNQFRDESLMSEEYFNAEKFPQMKYKATEVKGVEGDQYMLQGEFTMLGVTKPVEVHMALLQMDGKSVLVGSGSIDRTEFGMTPSATEGNVVDFTYQVLLDQK